MDRSAPLLASESDSGLGDAVAHAGSERGGPDQSGWTSRWSQHGSAEPPAESKSNEHHAEGKSRVVHS